MARVLVVDDQNIPRRTVEVMLKEGGYEVATEASGRSGLDRARDWSPDVIILDVHMPEMDGFEVVERLKSDPVTAPVPVVFLTGTAPRDELVVRGLDAGAYDFLTKGCSKAELLARVGVMARIKRSNDELTAIARIARTLLQTLDPDDLGRLFLEQTRNVFRAEAALFCTTRNLTGDPLEVALGLDGEDGRTGRIAAALHHHLSEAHQDADAFGVELLDGAARQYLESHDMSSVAAAVVEHDERPPTLAAVFARGPNRFRRESDGPLLQLLTGQAAVAMDNALLHAQTNEQAKQLERAMSDRSRFFASMSHELRTPINALIGYNELLMEGAVGDLSQSQRGILEKLGRSAYHLLELISDILDISKIEAGKFEIAEEPVELSTLLRDTATSVQLQAEKKELDLVIRTDARCTIQADPARVRQIVLNLLSNAVKFTDDGEIVLEMRSPGATLPDDAGWVEIAVCDTGPGIPPAQQERIFEEFEQGEAGSEKGGTGLGLPISRKLAELHGGTLEMTSEPGHGSIFTLKLPSIDPPERAEQPGGTTIASQSLDL